MAEAWDHEIDTRNAVKGTTSPDNIDLIVKAVFFVIDGTYKRENSESGKGFETLDYLLEHLKRYGITEDSLYNDLLNAGISPDEINKINEANKEKLYSNKKDFLQKWLLPSAVGKNKHQFTHKGWDHNYSPEDGNDWSGQGKNQSWNVKKKLLIEILMNVYQMPRTSAEKAALLLYNVHRLRDAQYNGTKDQKPGEYLNNIPDDLEKYILPLIKDNKEKQEFAKEIADYRNSQKEYFDNYFEKGYNDNNSNSPLYKQINKLIGPLKGDDGGMLRKIFYEIVRPEAPMGLKPEVLSDSEISLTWNGQKKDELHYNIYIGESPDSLKKAELKNLKEPSFKVENLEADTMYYFAVTCCSYEMESEKSKIVSARTKNKKIIVVPLPKNGKPGEPPPKPTKISIPWKSILIIIGIILLILLILWLLRSCPGCTGGGRNGNALPGDSCTSGGSNGKALPGDSCISQPPPPPEEDKEKDKKQPKREISPILSEMTEKLFVADSSELLPEAKDWLVKKVVPELSKFIEQNPSATFKVTGYAAVFPGLPDPVELSRERANKIISELGARGIDVNKLQAFSGGETNKWGNNFDESTRAPNRRIVIQQK